MTDSERLLAILLVAVVTLLIRALPFLVFSGKRKPPRFVLWLGEQLPRAVMAMLLIYCLKDVRFAALSGWLPALAGVAVTALLHLWKRQMMLSIAGGTAVYMLLLRLTA